MTLSFSCRVATYFFCVFSYFSSVSANITNPQFAIRATNTISSSQDSLATCKISTHGELEECKEFSSTVKLNNPIAIAVNANNLFVANHGGVKVLGTSFLLKCDLPALGVSEVSCQSILALVSASHLTGMSILGNKVFFVQSFSYGLNSNFNYLVACDIPQGRISAECGSSLYLPSLLPNPQAGFNTSMPIIIVNDAVYVLDNFGGTVFKCAMPDGKNNTTCQRLTTDEASKEYPESLVSPTVLSFQTI